MSQDPDQKYLNNGTNFVQTIHSKPYPAIAPSTNDLVNKTIFINGASKGIGRAIAASYAQTGASHIIIAARSSLSDTTDAIIAASKSANRDPPTVIPLTVDISSREEVDAALQTVLKHKDFASGERKIDILVNNAGWMKGFEPIADSNPDEWWREWEINVKGTYLVTRAFLPLVLASELKTIANVASLGATMILPGASGYHSNKLAILRFTEHLQAEYADKGLLALIVHPGGVMTGMADNFPVAFHGFFQDAPELPGNAIVWLTKERREWLAARFFECPWDVEELEKRKEDILKGDLLKVRLAVNLY